MHPHMPKTAAIWSRTAVGTYNPDSETFVCGGVAVGHLPVFTLVHNADYLSLQEQLVHVCCGAKSHA